MFCRRFAIYLFITAQRIFSIIVNHNHFRDDASSEGEGKGTPLEAEAINIHATRRTQLAQTPIAVDIGSSLRAGHPMTNRQYLDPESTDLC